MARVRQTLMDQPRSAGIRQRSCFFLFALIALAWLLTGCGTAPATPPVAAPAVATECNLLSFTATATWTGAQEGALLGQLTLTNYASQPCPLAGKFELSVLNENLQPMVVIDPSANQDFSIVIQPEQSYQVLFRWQNWCGPIPAGGLTLQFTVTNSSAALTVPLQDPNGQPLDDTPGCTDAGQPSRLLWED